MVVKGPFEDAEAMTTSSQSRNLSEAYLSSLCPIHVFDQRLGINRCSTTHARLPVFQIVEGQNIG